MKPIQWPWAVKFTHSSKTTVPSMFLTFLCSFTVIERKIRLCGSVSDSHPTLLKNTEYLSNVSIWQCTLVGGRLGGGIRQWAKLLAPAVWRVRVTQLRPRMTPPPSSTPQKPIVDIAHLRKKKKNVSKDRPCLILALGNRAAIFVLLELQTFPSDCGWSWVLRDV